MKLSNKIKKLPFNITEQRYISSIYFNNILDNMIKIISKNEKKNIKILDFGCGQGYLKKRLKKNKQLKVIGFDVVKELSDVVNWKMVKFDYFLACHVFVYLKKKKIENIITNFSLTADEEINLLCKHMKIIKKVNIFFLTDVYLLEF